MIKINLTLFLTAAAILYVNVVTGIEVKCKGIEVKVTEEQLMNVKECLKTIGVESIKDLKPDTAGCFSRCVMEKKELIDASGKPHKENINRIIDEHVPAPLIEDWKVEIGKCLDNEGSKLKSAADDPQCSSYLPLAMCTHAAFLKVCAP